MLLLSARMGRLAQRIGPRRPMTIGPIVVGLRHGVARPDRPVGELPHRGAAGRARVRVGLSATVAPLTATVLAAAPAHQVGVASAVNNDVARTAGLLAVAVLPALAGITPAAYAQPDLLSSGFHNAVLIAAGLCACGGLLSWIFIRDDVLVRGASAGTHCEPCATPLRGAVSVEAEATTR